MILKLSQPVTWADSEIDQLELNPTPRHFKDFKVKVTDSGVEFEPYAFARMGLRMANQPGDEKFLEKMCIEDMNALADLVLGFFGRRPSAGLGG